MVTQEWETLEELQGLHIVDENDVLDPKELYNKIEPYLDYDIYYAEDRIKQIKDNWDEELYIRCVSTEKFRGQQVKKTTSLLSEDTPMTYHLDKLSDYILYSHYDNTKQEEEFQKISQELQEKKDLSSKERTNEDKKKILENQDKLKSRPRMLSRKIEDKMKKEDVDSLQMFFDEESSLDREPSLFPVVNYTSVDKELNQKGHFKNNKRYWAHFTPPRGNKVPHYGGETIPYAKLAYETLSDMEEAISVREEEIEKVDFFRFLEKQRLNDLDENLQMRDGEQEIMNPVLENERKRLVKIKHQIRGEYNTAAEILRKRVVLSNSAFSQGEPVTNDAWERMSLRDPETYLALILGYGELKENYATKVGTTMWSMIRDFEDMLDRLKLSEEESVILSALLRDGKISDVAAQQEILHLLSKEVPTRTVNNIINNLIPKRFFELHEQDLEEWIWTYRRKGTYKTCKKCGRAKLARHFSTYSRNKDGLHTFCKNCRAKNATVRQKDAES